MRFLLFSIFILLTHISFSQCACVWVDLNGDVQCYLYNNCSGPNLSNCASKVTGGTMCPCEVYPGMNWLCGGCQSNGACWYNGTSCDADMVCGYIALPVELISFSGYWDGYVNIIEWETASEINSSHFILQHSTDGINWNPVATLPGAGNTTQIQRYHTQHYNVEKLTNYYRLDQFDFDGEYKQYDVISIDNRTTEKKIMKIFNMMGQEVDINSKGLKVIIYDDGTSTKKMN